MKAKQIWISLHSPGEGDFADVDLMMQEHCYEPIDPDEGWVEDRGIWQCSFGKVEEVVVGEEEPAVCGAHIAGHHASTCTRPSGHMGNCTDD